LDEIEIDPGHRVSVSAEAGERQGIRVRFVLGALAASSGLAWIAITSMASPFGLTSVGGLTRYRFLTPDAAPPRPLIESPAAPAADAKREGGFQDRATVVRKTDRAVSADSLSLFSSNRWNPATGAPQSAVAALPAPAASKHSAAPRRDTASIETRAVKPHSEPHTEARLVPVPETRPTTVEGWQLREIDNGTAVLEGPGGTFKARRGDTVPGLGKVVAIVRWGNRLIVATSKGLISTRK